MINESIMSLLPTTEAADQRKAVAKLIGKWDRTGLLEGCKDDNEKGHVAVLLQNQARQILREANSTGTSANSEEWAGIALPLVRRIFKEISAQEYMSVQSMNMPNGLIFYLDHKYATGQPGFNTNAGRTSQNDSLYGVTDPAKGTGAPYGWATPTEGLYGPGRFGYTINDYSSSALQPGATVSATAFTTASVSAADYNFNSEFSQSIVVPGSRLHKITVSASAIPNFDEHGVRAFTLSNSTNTLVYELYNEFTKYNSSNKTVQFIISGSVVSGSNRIKVNYHKQPTDITRGDFEEGKTQAGGGSEALDIPEIDLQLRSEPITAKTRKLKAKWTPEFSQDLNAYHHIDAEAELTALLSEYISHEIDHELLDMLIHGAPFVDYWSTRIGWQWNGVNGFTKTGENVTQYTQQTWFQTLGTKLQKLSNRIAASTLRGGANFMVCGPTISTVIESIPGYAPDTDGDKTSYAFGVQKVGMLHSRFKVFKNPYMRENVILMGYKGNQFLETGAVYSPYIPLVMTPLVLDQDNFTPRKGVMTRYAKKMVRPEFYAKLYVDGLNLI